MRHRARVRIDQVRTVYLHSPTTTIYLIEVGAIVLGAFAGWLGGELVDRLGVGVDDGANLNARNSLSGRPARQAATPHSPLPTPHTPLPRTNPPTP